MFNSNVKTDVFLGLKDSTSTTKSNIAKTAFSKGMFFIKFCSVIVLLVVTLNSWVKLNLKLMSINYHLISKPPLDINMLLHWRSPIIPLYYFLFSQLVRNSKCVNHIWKTELMFTNCSNVCFQWRFFSCQC